MEKLAFSILFIIFASVVVLLFFPLISSTHAQFAPESIDAGNGAPGFFSGIWHGLMAPWTLLLRLFMDIKTYASPNAGWFYDGGFLVGIVGSIPIGWFATIIALLIYFF